MLTPLLLSIPLRPPMLLLSTQLPPWTLLSIPLLPTPLLMLELELKLDPKPELNLEPKLELKPELELKVEQEVSDLNWLSLVGLELAELVDLIEDKADMELDEVKMGMETVGEVNEGEWELELVRWGIDPFSLENIFPKI